MSYLWDSKSFRGGCNKFGFNGCTSRDWEGGRGRDFRDIGFYSTNKGKSIMNFYWFLWFWSCYWWSYVQSWEYIRNLRELNKRGQYYYFREQKHFRVKIMHILETFGVYNIHEEWNNHWMVFGGETISVAYYRIAN